MFFFFSFAVGVRDYVVDSVKAMCLDEVNAVRVNVVSCFR